MQTMIVLYRTIADIQTLPVIATHSHIVLLFLFPYLTQKSHLNAHIHFGAKIIKFVTATNPHTI